MYKRQGILFTGVFRMGLYGVIFAGILSNGYRAVDFVIYISKNIVNESWKSTLKNVFFSVLIIAATFWISSHIRFGELTIIMWVINSCVVGMVSLLLVLLFSLLFQRENLYAVMGRVRLLFQSQGDNP